MLPVKNSCVVCLPGSAEQLVGWQVVFHGWGAFPSAPAAPTPTTPAALLATVAAAAAAGLRVRRLQVQTERHAQRAVQAHTLTCHPPHVWAGTVSVEYP